MPGLKDEPAIVESCMYSVSTCAYIHKAEGSNRRVSAIYSYVHFSHFTGESKFQESREKYISGPRYWNVPVLVNTGTFLVYQYCLKM